MIVSAQLEEALVAKIDALISAQPTVHPPVWPFAHLQVKFESLTAGERKALATYQEAYRQYKAKGPSGLRTRSAVVRFIVQAYFSDQDSAAVKA